MTDRITVLRSYPSIEACTKVLRLCGYEPDEPRTWRHPNPLPGEPSRVRILTDLRAYPNRCRVVRADVPGGGMAA